MIFPHGVVYDSANRRFGTTKISVLYRALRIEKASEEASSNPVESQKYYLVAGAGLEPATSWL